MVELVARACSDGLAGHLDDDVEVARQVALSIGHCLGAVLVEQAFPRERVVAVVAEASCVDDRVADDGGASVDLRGGHVVLLCGGGGCHAHKIGAIHPRVK